MTPYRWRDPLYLALFIALTGALWGLTLRQTQEWADAVQVMAAAVVIAAAITITVREVVEMLAEAFKRQMRQLGHEEGRKEGIEVGVERGGRNMLDRLVKNGMISEEQRKQIEKEPEER